MNRYREMFALATAVCLFNQPAAAETHSPMEPSERIGLVT